MRRSVLPAMSACCVAAWCMVAGALLAVPASSAYANDYPTDARADYVFACMAGNGQTHDNLERCSCSIDSIAEAVPYEKYVQAETILRMRQVPGDKTGEFRDPPWIKQVIDDLRRAQTEAELKCF